MGVDMGRARSAGVVGGLAVALVTGGCAQWQGHADERDSSRSCSTPGVTANTINLGMIYPNTGDGARLFGQYSAGVDARLGVQNAAGGVYGRKVVYEWQDDRTDQTGNLAAAKNLTDRNQSFAIRNWSGLRVSSIC
jgi:branched-chain amino acid transport system substrate-binding protein